MDSSSQKHRPVLKADAVVRTRIREPLRTGSEVLLVIGGALWLVGLVRVLLLWLPPDLGTPGWRFGTVSQTMALLPVSAAGAALFSYGLVRSPDRDGSRIRVLAAVFVGIAATFPVLGVIYLTALPTVFGSAPEVTVAPLRRSVIETLVELIVACAACVAVARTLWHGVNRKRRGDSELRGGRHEEADDATDT